MKLDDKITQWNKENHSKKKKQSTNSIPKKSNDILECNCGHKNENESIYCAECGSKLNLIKNKDNSNKSSIFGKNSVDGWIKSITTYCVIFAVINLALGAWLGAGILIFFAILIWTSKNYTSIYALGVIWLLLAFFQFAMGSLYQYNYIEASYDGEGLGLFFLSIINFAFGGWVIYKTQKFNNKRGCQIG